MSTISALPSSIVGWLNSVDRLKGIKFLTEYPPEYKAVPLRRPIVSVGLKDVSIVDHFTANDEGVLEKDEYCRTATIDVVLSIHVPFSQGGNKCHEVFTSVVDALTFSSDLEITQSKCEHISSDRNTEALVMDAVITIQSDFCPAQEVDESFHSFMDKELLCGSHIRNDEIHITATERDRWNNRFVYGTYSGNNSASRSIVLGFKPAYLVVFPEGDFPVYYNKSSATMETMFGFSAENNHSYGIEVTSNGFRILNGNSHTVDGNTPFLNKMGCVYSYFAIKPN